MARTKDLIKDHLVQIYLQKYQGAEKQIKAAVKELSEVDDGRVAIRKVLPALKDQKLYIFFSYKSKDEKAAKAIVKILRKYAAGKLKIGYMADFTKEIAGKDWRDKIRKEVRRANWFILLLPDPSEDWDWCLYETGIFDREPTSADRLICLHHPDIKIPNPIKDYHAVPAKLSNIKEFLEMVYIKTSPIPGMESINPDIQSDIPDIAKEIVNAIRPPKKDLEHKIYEPFIKLKLRHASEMACKEDLDKSVIIDSNRRALKIFDHEDCPDTLGELREGVEEASGDGRWRDELFHVIRKIARRRRFSPVHAVFHTRDGETFRPVAHAIDRTKDEGEIKSFHITFTEDVGALNTSEMPQGVVTLTTMLRLAFRFRWEVLEKFKQGLRSEADVKRLSNVLNRIEMDAKSRGIMDRNIDMNFFLPEQQVRVQEMYDYWFQLRDPVGDSGRLDVALENNDIDTITEVLKEMVPLNQEFLDMAAERFADIVACNSQYLSKAV